MPFQTSSLNLTGTNGLSPSAIGNDPNSQYYEAPYRLGARGLSINSGNKVRQTEYDHQSTSALDLDPSSLNLGPSSLSTNSYWPYSVPYTSYNTDKVIVFLLTDRPYDLKVADLIRFFQSSSFFELKVVNIPPPPTLKHVSTLTTRQAVELHRFVTVLEEAFYNYPKNSVIVLKDTSVSVCTVLTLEAVVRQALQLGEWHFCYLTRWLDRCELYRHPVPVSGTMTTLVETKSPNGTQAILFSPLGRDVIIGRRKMNNGLYFTPIQVPLGTKMNRSIVDGFTTAICAVPNQFEFDVLQATNTADLAKLSDCQRPEPTTRASAIPLFWFIIVVLAVILIAWALWVIGPSRHSSKSQATKTEESGQESPFTSNFFNRDHVSSQ